MSSIVYAATTPTIAAAAYQYLQANCSIIPLTGKRPTLAWDEFKTARPSAMRVGFWLRSGKMKNIGLVCGSVSCGLVVIDVDSRAACAEFESAFPALLDTLTIISGSGRGKHYYFYADDVPANAWRDGVELRSDGAYVVAPPSVHPESGQPYTVERPFDVKRLPNLESVRRWIIDRGNGNSPAAAPQRPPNNTPSAVRDASSYGRRALDDETDKVAHASEGGANNALNLAAFKLGRLVAAGHLSEGEVERALEAAATALSQRDGVEATRRTIRSGLTAGIAKSRTVA